MLFAKKKKGINLQDPGQAEYSSHSVRFFKSKAPFGNVPECKLGVVPLKPTIFSLLKPARLP